MKIHYFFFISSCWCWISCGGSQPAGEEKPIARVNNQYLYPSDIQGIGQNMSDQDSVYQVKVYADKWVQDQLLLGVAQKSVTETPRMKRLVEAYRASLILEDYERELIQERMDTFVSPQQIAEYYTQNQEQYQLGEDYVRCLFVKARRDLAGVEQLREWIRAGGKDNFDKLAKYCTENKTTHILDESVWIKLDKITAKLPEGTFSPKYLDGTILDKTDDEFLYLMKTVEYRDRTEPSPLQEVQHDIKKIILYQRRQKILDDLRAEVYKNAKESKTFEVF